MPGMSLQAESVVVSASEKNIFEVRFLIMAIPLSHVGVKKGFKI